MVGSRPAGMTTLARAARGVAPAERNLLHVVSVVAVGVGAWGYATRVFPFEPVDLEGYFVAVRAFMQGELPPPSRAIHPPALLLLVTPLVRLPPDLAGGLWRGISVAAYLATLWLLWRLYREKLTGAESAIAVLAAASFPAAFSTLRYGQVNLIGAFLIVLAVVCTVRARPALGGVILGISLALKPAAVMVIPGMILLGQFRFAAAGATTLLLAFVASSALVYSPLGLGVWLTSGLPTLLGGTSGSGQPYLALANQSISGMLVRLAGADGSSAAHLAGGVLSILLAIGMLVRLRLTSRMPLSCDDRLLAVSFLLTGTLLASPLTWPFYTAFLTLPLAATYLAVRSCSTRLARIAFGAAAYALVGHDLWHDIWPYPGPVPLPLPMVAFTQSAQFLGLLALLGLQGALLRSRPGDAEPGGSSG